MKLSDKNKAINNNCICCNHKNWRLIKNADGGNYLKCKFCGYQIQSTHDFANSDKQFEEEQNKFYDEESVCLSPLFLSLEQKSTSKRLKALKRFLPSGKILEIGPGSGAVLSQVKSLGYDAEAIEHSEALAKSIKKKLDVNVKVGAFEDIKLKDNSYDAYMSFHVIEHVPDVLTHLQKANSIVKKGGYAFIATPNANSLEHKLPFALSPNFSTAHFQLFTQKSLTLCLNKTGWKVIGVTTPSYPDSWLRVITAVIRKTRDKNKSAPRGEYMKSSNPKLENAVKIFDILTFPFRFIQEYTNYGNELFIVAIKTK